MTIMMLDNFILNCLILGCNFYLYPNLKKYLITKLFVILYVVEKLKYKIIFQSHMDLIKNYFCINQLLLLTILNLRLFFCDIHFYGYYGYFV